MLLAVVVVVVVGISRLIRVERLSEKESPERNASLAAELRETLTSSRAGREELHCVISCRLSCTRRKFESESQSIVGERAGRAKRAHSTLH
jgi:hypothetical protein